MRLGDVRLRLRVQKKLTNSLRPSRSKKKREICPLPFFSAVHQGVNPFCQLSNFPRHLFLIIVSSQLSPTLLEIFLDSHNPERPSPPRSKFFFSVPSERVKVLRSSRQDVQEMVRKIAFSRNLIQLRYYEALRPVTLHLSSFSSFQW